MQQRLHFDADIPATLNNLATLMLRQKKLSEAEPFFRQSSLLLKNAGNMPVELATCLRSHTVVLRDLGNLDEAERVSGECLNLCQQDHSLQDDWRRFDAMSLLGEILVRRKQYEAAEPLLLSGQAGLLKHADQIPAANKPRLKQTFDRLIALYKAWDKPQQASEWEQKLLAASLPQP